MTVVPDFFIVWFLVFTAVLSAITTEGSMLSPELYEQLSKFESQPLTKHRRGIVEQLGRDLLQGQGQVDFSLPLTFVNAIDNKLPKHPLGFSWAPDRLHGPARLLVYQHHQAVASWIINGLVERFPLLATMLQKQTLVITCVVTIDQLRMTLSWNHQSINLATGLHPYLIGSE